MQVHSILGKQVIQDFEASIQEDCAENNQSVAAAGQNGDPDTPPNSLIPSIQ